MTAAQEFYCFNEGVKSTTDTFRGFCGCLPEPGITLHHISKGRADSTPPRPGPAELMALGVECLFFFCSATFLDTFPSFSLFTILLTRPARERLSHSGPLRLIPLIQMVRKRQPLLEGCSDISGIVLQTSGNSDNGCAVLQMSENASYDALYRYVEGLLICYR